MTPLLYAIGLSLAGAVALGFLYLWQRSMAASYARRRVVPFVATEQATDPLRTRSGRLPLVNLLPMSAASRARMEIELERAAAPLRTSEYLAARTIAALALATVAAVLLRPLHLGLALVPIALMSAALGWALPRLWVRQLAARRLDAIEGQIPDALTAIAKSLRAGSGLLQALAFAADDTPAPLGDELARTLRELRLGADPEQVFSALSERVGSPDLDIAVTAILIQRSVGGNLAEILNTVTNTVRERALLHAEVKVLTTRQRVTGNLMAAMPVLVAVAFIALNPTVGRLLIDTFAGRVSLAIGLAFEVGGLFLIRRLGVIEV